MGCAAVSSLSFLSGSFTLSLCLSGGSLLSGLLSSSSQLGSSGSALLSDSSGFSLVGLNLLSEESFGSSSFLVCLSLADLAGFGILLCFPSVETTLSLFLTEGTLGYTTLEVLAKQYTLVGKDSANGVGRLSTYGYPIQCTLEIEDHCSRVGVGVERADTLDVLAVTRRTAVCYYDVVESVVFVTMTSQTKLCCHFRL